MQTTQLQTSELGTTGLELTDDDVATIEGRA